MSVQQPPLWLRHLLETLAAATDLDAMAKRLQKIHVVGILNYLFEGRSETMIFLLCFALVVFDATIDYMTGYEMTYFVFYILPVLLASWYSGRVMGCVVSLIAAIAWLMVDLADGHPYSHHWYAYWNGTWRFTFFLLVSQLTSTIRDHLELEKTMARIDELTGAPNRLAFREKCDVIFPLASREGSPMALGLIDLDDFKQLNDRYSYNFGDQVLKEVSLILRQTMRKTDVMGRVGGDEFAILLPNADAAAAHRIFDYLHHRLADKARSSGWPIGFSIGVAVIEAPEITTDQAIQFAHNLMQQAKINGKNRVICDGFNKLE